ALAAISAPSSRARATGSGRVWMSIRNLRLAAYCVRTAARCQPSHRRIQAAADGPAGEIGILGFQARAAVGLTDVGHAPIATKFRTATKGRDVPGADIAWLIQ